MRWRRDLADCRQLTSFEQQKESCAYGSTDDIWNLLILADECWWLHMAAVDCLTIAIFHFHPVMVTYRLLYSRVREEMLLKLLNKVKKLLWRKKNCFTWIKSLGLGKAKPRSQKKISQEKMFYNMCVIAWNVRNILPAIQKDQEQKCFHEIQFTMLLLSHQPGT